MRLFTNKLVLLTALGHFTVDTYANFLPVMYPLLVVPLNLSTFQVGTIASGYAFAQALGQPLFGHLADRFGSRLLASLGIAVMAVFMCVAGFSWDYVSLLAFAFLAASGSSAFHPQAMMNAALAGGEKKGSGLSIYMLGGNVGFALGPLIAGALFSTALGLRSLLFLIPPGLLVALLTYRAMRRVDWQRRQRNDSPAPPMDSTSPTASELGSLAMLLTLRSWAYIGIGAYLPLLITSRGMSIGFAGQVLFVLLMAMAIGTLVGGILSDRMSRRLVAFITLLLCSPAIYLLLHTPANLSVVAAFGAGLLMGASMPITILATQELLPRNLGMASGLAQGFGFVTGGIGVAVTGYVADSHGLAAALTVLAFTPFFAAFFALGVPDRRSRGLSMSSTT